MISSSSPDQHQFTAQTNDGISHVSWHPTQDFLAVSTWDNQTSVYEVGAGGGLIPRTAIPHQAPPLANCWNASMLFAAGTDNTIQCFDLASSSIQKLCGHTAPIRSLAWLPTSNLLVSAGWDKTLQYWDLRSASTGGGRPVASVGLPERVYCMDTDGRDRLVVGCAERHICTISLTANPTVVHRTIQSPLKWQTRCIGLFAGGFAVGSIEGRVALAHDTTTTSTSKDFAFKCHRDDASSSIYAVNSISFHPIHGTFATAGSDGTWCFWDKESRQRLKQSPSRAPTSISCGSFNRNGSYYAYGVSYDWSRGATTTSQNTLVVMTVRDQDIRPKAPAPWNTTRRR